VKKGRTDCVLPEQIYNEAPRRKRTGYLGASLRIQSKIKQFELLHPSCSLFFIGALISDVISGILISSNSIEALELSINGNDSNS